MSDHPNDETALSPSSPDSGPAEKAPWRAPTLEEVDYSATEIRASAGYTTSLSTPAATSRTAAANAVLLRSERAFVRRRDGESYLVRPAERSEAKLSAVAAEIVEALGAPTTSNDVCARISARFDVGPDECARAVSGFVDQLIALGAVEARADEAPPPALRRRYLDVLKRALVNLVYAEDALRLDALRSAGPGDDPLAQQRLLRDVRYQRPDAYAEVVATKREGGLDRFWARASRTR